MLANKTLVQEHTIAWKTIWQKTMMQGDKECKKLFIKTDSDWITSNADLTKFQINPEDELHKAVAQIKTLTFEKRDSKDEPNRPESDEATIKLLVEIGDLVQVNNANAT